MWAFVERVKGPRLRKAAGVIAVSLVVWALGGFLLLPAILRPIVERKIGEALHRKATLRSLSINPFALSATLKGLDVKDGDGTSPFLSFESLYVNAEASSIFRGGPVLREITLVKPAVHVARLTDTTYSVSDLIEEYSKPKPKDDKPLRFSLNNIRLEAGSLDFDDRPKKTKHTVRDLRIGIPFLSNIPSKVEITTQPVFEAKVNGAPFALHGTTKPFSETRETTLDLELTDVDVPYYLAYVPSEMPSKLKSARLDAKLTFAFHQPLQGDPALVISGTAALRKFAIEQGSEPLLAWERFDADAEAIDVFGRSARLRSLRLAAPELWIRRHTMAEHDIANALAAPGRRTETKEETSAKEKGKPAAGEAKPFQVDLAEAGIERGTVHYDDFAFHPAFHTVLQGVAVSLKGFSTRSGKPAALEASATSEVGETFRDSGTLSMEEDAVDVQGTFSVENLPLKRYTTFVDEFVPVELEAGILALKTGYRFTTGPKANNVLTDLGVTVAGPRVRKKSEREPFFAAQTLAMTGTSLDLAKHALNVGEIKSAKGLVAIVRLKDGNADLMELMPKPDPSAPPPQPSDPWNVSVKRFALTGYTVKIEDLGWDHAARYALTNADVTLEGMSTAKGSKGALAVKFGVDGKGLASAKGPIGISPIFADLNIAVKGVDLVPLEAYVLPSLRLSLARGAVEAAGHLSLQEDPGGKASVVFTGDALVASVLAVDEATKLDFLKWDSFSAAGMRAGYNPLFVEVKQLAAVGISCDVTIDADGTVNLRKIVGAPPPPKDDEEATDETAVTPPAPTPEPTPAPKPETPAAAEKDPRLTMPVKIDEITLQGGRIGLADHFIKPNYSATLADLGGRVTGLSSEPGTVATLDLRGNLANHSPLEISGTINPLAAATFADVKASFRDIDLAAFTPYSGTYAGYTIASGSLTMEVAYKVENRKLQASNRFLVNQFDFGDKVESGKATKLPVRFAVSLLKDKDGVIDLDLPIEGSLDDPKFRIGKVVWQILGNLITKAVTAPFALLGKLFGGKGDELSSVDFPDGLATLDDVGRKKLDALAKALKERPALKLQAMGRFSGADLEGLRTARVERKVKAQKLPDLAKAGTAPASVDDVVVEAAERETYLKRAYKKEKFPKPRTALGFAKDLPADEMEKLMLANETVGDDDLRQLALARGNAVKDYLTGSASSDPARVFILEPDAHAAAPKEKARASRVDFTLK